MKRFLKWVLSLLPKRYILFESIPDLSDNTKAVFDEMVSRGLDRKYKFIWYVNDCTAWNRKRGENVGYVDARTRWHRLQYFWYRSLAKCLISCNRFLCSASKRQKSFYLTHGTAIKSVHSYYNVPSTIDYMITAAEGTNEMMAYELNFDVNKVRALGFPRNDALLGDVPDAKQYFDGDFDKIIIWYPTFRQHHNGFKTAVGGALPILETAEEAERLNEYARTNSILVVVKPHFAQNVEYIKKHNLSNIRFIDDSFYTDNALVPYRFIGGCDALITDYSSVYFDYLLCDKPIGVVWADIEEYRQNPGFAIDLDQYLSGAEKIYTLDDFKKFLENVASGNDIKKAERNKICDWANISRDGKNSERVVDFIVSAANL